MTTALSLVPAAATRTAFTRGEARLTTPGPNRYATDLVPLDEAISALKASVAAEQLHDTIVPSLKAVDMDGRDGALTRGNGGMAYTDWAFGQLCDAHAAISPAQFFRGESAPGSIDRSALWCTPATRAMVFADVKAGSTRRAGEKGAVLFRTFIDANTGLRALRAVVTARHSAEHFDDAAVMEAVAAVSPEGSRGSFNRGWKFTYGRVIMPCNSHVSVGYGFRNSEVGAASLSMFGTIHIEALDSAIAFPEGIRYQSYVQVASRNDSTRRNHTLPRVNTSEARRRAIALARVTEDIGTALTASEALADGWERALVDVFPIMVTGGPEIVGDLLMEKGMEPVLVKSIIAVMADDTRVAALPRGSAAHLAACVAVVAAKSTTYEEALELQRLAGQICLMGWQFEV